MKILLVEDDAETADYILRGLREVGHNASLVRDGRRALIEAASELWDLLIVDRMVPLLDGVSMVRVLRGSGIDTPVLFLSALGEVEERVEGLDAGGDDYLAKPFAFSELNARVTALGRRPRAAHSETLLRVADLEVDLLTRRVRRAGQSIDLQPREFRLLEYLMRHAGQVVTRTMLLENVWEMHFDPHTNVVESHVSRLRSKIAQPGKNGAEGPELIHTIRGAGYCLRAPE